MGVSPGATMGRERPTVSMYSPLGGLLDMMLLVAGFGSRGAGGIFAAMEGPSGR